MNAPTAAQRQALHQARQQGEAVEALATEALASLDADRLRRVITGHLLGRPDMTADDVVTFGEDVSRAGWMARRSECGEN